MKKNIYFFTSDSLEESEVNVTILTSSLQRARVMILIKFKEWGYKGSPVQIL